MRYDGKSCADAGRDVESNEMCVVGDIVVVVLFLAVAPNDGDTDAEVVAEVSDNGVGDAEADDILVDVEELVEEGNRTLGPL